MGKAVVSAIIFDCFGVLVRGTLENFIDSHFGHDPKLVERAHVLDHQASAGFITFEEQVSEFAHMGGLSEQQVADELGDTPANEQLLSYIRDELKPRFKIGFLSNAGDDWTDELFKPEQKALFDDIVLSYAYGMAKPDERIYLLSAKNLGVLPGDCVFVDDIRRYCDGAVEAGMHAVQYNDFSQFKKEIETIL